MKIGIVSPYAYPRPGGANSYIRESYEELRRMGHDVRIITAPWGDRGAVQRRRRQDHAVAAARVARVAHARARAFRHHPSPRAARAVPLDADPRFGAVSERRDVPRLRRVLVLLLGGP